MTGRHTATTPSPSRRSVSLRALAPPLRRIASPVRRLVLAVGHRPLTFRQLALTVAALATALALVSGERGAARVAPARSTSAAAEAPRSAAIGLDGRSADRADRGQRRDPTPTPTGSETPTEPSTATASPADPSSGTPDPQPAATAPATPVPPPTPPRPSPTAAQRAVTASGTCRASYYATGSTTANGEHFNPDGLTAAHRTLPFGTSVRVTNLANGSAVTVRINDRGPFVAGRCIDLSRGAFRAVSSLGAGVLSIRYEVLR